MITEEKKAALLQIADIARAHQITLDEIGAYLTRLELKTKSSSWLANLMAYLGAAFIFGGLSLYVAMVWDDLNSLSRVIITLGPGLIAFILGLIANYDRRFVRAATPLYLKAAILQPFGMFTFLKEFVPDNDPQLGAILVFGLLSVQFLITFSIKRQTSLLFFGYLFCSTALGMIMERNSVPGELLGLALGTSLMTFAWHIDQTIHRPIAAFYYFLGSIGFLWSLFDIVEHSALDILFLPASVTTMLLSTRIRSRTLLLVGTFALLGFLGYYTEEYFKDITGWPIALMLMGFALIGISIFALRLGHKIKEQT